MKKLLILFVLVSPLLNAGMAKCKLAAKALREKHSPSLVVTNYQKQFWYYVKPGMKTSIEDQALLEDVGEKCVGYVMWKGIKNGKPAMSCGPEREVGTGTVKTFCSEQSW